MRIAALYDIHGNVHALRAVLAELEHEQVDAVVVGGDIAAGPFPRETLELVRTLKAVCIRGNADWREGDWGAHEWVWAQLGTEGSAWLKALPADAVVGDAFFCHATPTSDVEVVTPDTSDEQLEEILDGVEQELVVAGHTHMQQDRRAARWRFVNAGSVGRPFEDTPGAYWAIVGDTVELRRTDYDLEAAAAAVRASGHPRAAELAEENLLSVPSREDGLAHFAPLAARVRVGRVGRRHGLDGSFVVEDASEDQERFGAGVRLYAAGRVTRVIASKRAGGRPVIKLDRDVARGAELTVPVAELPFPEPGSYYAFQLAGLDVVEEEGRRLGRVSAVTPGVANDVIELDTGLALPMVDACVREIDLQRGVILVARGYGEPG